jgi:hypothetical protein
MLGDQKGSGKHERFQELCALACAGGLAPLELSELRTHLDHCDECDEVFLQYQTLSTEGMAILAEGYAERQDHAGWNDEPTRQGLLARVRADQHQQMAAEPRSATVPTPVPVRVQPRLTREASASPLALMAIAAGLILAVGFGAYRLGERAPRADSNPVRVSADNRFQQLSEEKRAEDALLAQQAAKLARLEEESSAKEQELAKLRSALQAVEDRSRQEASTNGQYEEQLKAISQQRDTLNAQVQAATLAYQNDRTELATLRAERDKTILRTSSLEGKIEELTAANRDQERRLKDSEQYLASDRDIRELMGARKLYIADVFDVDGSSRTQKPFGRIFYTQGKSLIFYAFDLDREPGVVNASTFQVWGQREAPQGEQASPMNLGILYMDNETNRRWVMRFDDPKQLAEIDAVFVTVEPRGGSHKPTGKPFLYALLRKEANHP